MEEWEILERSEKSGLPAFTQYFRTHKLDDMRAKMAAFILKDLGLGNKSNEQNMPESVNDMMKDWTWTDSSLASMTLCSPLTKKKN